MLNIAITDDIREDAEQLRSALADYARDRGRKFNFTLFRSSEELMDAYHPHQFAVIFLDIYMDGLSGIEAAKKIRLTDSSTLLVFLTSSTEHMPEAFGVHAYDYIRKPIDPARLTLLMDDIFKQYSPADNIPRLTFSVHRKDYSLPYPSITAVSSQANYLEITDRFGNVYKPRMTFSAVSKELLADQRFLMILRGVLVNMDHIIGFSEKTCQMEGGLTLPINIRNSRKIEQTWLTYTLSKIRQESVERGFY